MIDIHDPGNVIDIQEVYIFLSVDELGRKGICASIIPNLGSTPLVTVNIRLLDAMKKLAEQMSLATGKQVQLYRFARDIDPIWETGK